MWFAGKNFQLICKKLNSICETFHHWFTLFALTPCWLLKSPTAMPYHGLSSMRRNARGGKSNDEHLTHNFIVQASCHHRLKYSRCSYCSWNYPSTNYKPNSPTIVWKVRAATVPKMISPETKKNFKTFYNHIP